MIDLLSIGSVKVFTADNSMQSIRKSDNQETLVK